MILDALTSLVKAVTDLIKTAWPKRADSPVRRKHLIQSNTGTLAHLDWIIVEPHCFYCGELQSQMKDPAGEYCPYFH